MFDNIKLLTKRDNKITEPNTTWDIKSKIHCSCELHLGLGAKYIWTDSNSIPFSKLLHFYTVLANSVRNPNKSNNQYSFKNNHITLTFDWVIDNSNNIELSLRHTQNKIDEIVLKKTLWNGTFYSYRNNFYMTVMTILINQTNQAMCIHVGKQFFRETDNSTYEFQIGQRVKTVLGENVKTPRNGHIIDRFRHYEYKTNMYLLMVDGKVLVKRYLPSDLELY